MAQEVIRTEHGVKLEVPDGTFRCEVQFYTPSIVRVVKYPQAEMPEEKSLAVVLAPEEVKFNVKVADDVVTLKSSELTVTLDKQGGTVAFADKQGAPLLAEQAGASNAGKEALAGDRDLAFPQEIPLGKGVYLHIVRDEGVGAFFDLVARQKQVPFDADGVGLPGAVAVQHPARVALAAHQTGLGRHGSRDAPHIAVAEIRQRLQPVGRERRGVGVDKERLKRQHE